MYHSTCNKLKLHTKISRFQFCMQWYDDRATVCYGRGVAILHIQRRDRLLERNILIRKDKPNLHSGAFFYFADNSLFGNTCHKRDNIFILWKSPIKKFHLNVVLFLTTRFYVNETFWSPFLQKFGFVRNKQLWKHNRCNFFSKSPLPIWITFFVKCL